MTGGAFSVSRVRTRQVIEAGYRQLVVGLAEHPLGVIRYQCQCKWWTLVPGLCRTCAKPSRQPIYGPWQPLTAARLLDRLKQKARQRAARRRSEAFW